MYIEQVRLGNPKPSVRLSVQFDINVKRPKEFVVEYGGKFYKKSTTPFPNGFFPVGPLPGNGSETFVLRTIHYLCNAKKIATNR